MATQQELMNLLNKMWKDLLTANLTIGEIAGVLSGLQNALNQVKVNDLKTEDKKE